MVVHNPAASPALAVFAGKTSPAALIALLLPALLMGAAVFNLQSGKAATSPPPAAQHAASPVAAPRSAPDMTTLEQAAFAALNRASLGPVRQQTVTMRPGATLSSVLENAGVERGEAAQAIQALDHTYNPRQLRAGQTLRLSLRRNRDGAESNASYHLTGLSTKPDVTRTILLARNINGDFSARELVMDLKPAMARARGAIKASLYVDALEAGASDAVVAIFAQIFAYSVDFQRGIHPGDRFDMVFEDFRDDQGKSIKTGNLVYVMLTPHGKTKAYYRFESKPGEVGYYDADGHSAKRFLMRTPVKGARISSGFGRRFHPILGYTRMHKGVDFAAGRGTPVLAAGNGVIERASRFGSYGNYIRIRHANGFKTAYAHLSRYGHGIRKGHHVSQSQIIGYVGATGRATGPHLHYEVLKNNRQVNPMTVKAPTGRKLGPRDMAAFSKEKIRIDVLVSKAAPAGDAPSALASAG